MIKKNFHHGDLRNSLIQLALTELEKLGVEQLSLRELAKSLGVSRAAPYRHFENKEALLQNLAEIGVEQLGNAYMRVANKEASAVDRLRLACKAYIDFATEKPELYRLIFSGDLEWPDIFEINNQYEDSKTTLNYSENSFGFFESLVSAAVESDDPKTVRNATLVAWSLIHGYAKLKMDGILEAFTNMEEFESVLLNAVGKVGKEWSAIKFFV